MKMRERVKRGRMLREREFWNEGMSRRHIASVCVLLDMLSLVCIDEQSPPNRMPYLPTSIPPRVVLVASAPLSSSEPPHPWLWENYSSFVSTHLLALVLVLALVPVLTLAMVIALARLFPALRLLVLCLVLLLRVLLNHHNVGRAQ